MKKKDTDLISCTAFVPCMCIIAICTICVCLTALFLYEHKGDIDIEVPEQPMEATTQDTVRDTDAYVEPLYDEAELTDSEVVASEEVENRLEKEHNEIEDVLPTVMIAEADLGGDVGDEIYNTISDSVNMEAQTNGRYGYRDIICGLVLAYGENLTGVEAITENVGDAAIFDVPDPSPKHYFQRDGKVVAVWTNSKYVYAYDCTQEALSAGIVY